MSYTEKTDPLSPNPRLRVARTAESGGVRMTKQEAIKKAIEVMYNNKHPYKSQSTTVSGAYIDYRQFAQVAQQIIEELGYDD